MHTYVGTISKIYGGTFVLTYIYQDSEKRLAAALVVPDATRQISVGDKVRISGEWAGKLGKGALTTFSVREIEFLED